MNVRTLLGHVVTGVAVSCAVLMTAITVHRELAPSTTKHLDGLPETTKVDNFKDYLQGGHQLGLSTAPVTILEFGDFECPACRAFALHALKGVRARYPNDVRVIFRHWPLSYHKMAMPAARASECASAQGRFEQFFDAVYAHQDSLGLKPFEDFAADAGVPDLAAFKTCIKTPGSVLAIENDIAAAQRLNGVGTPTVVINGLEIKNIMDSIGIDSLIRKQIGQARR